MLGWRFRFSPCHTLIPWPSDAGGVGALRVGCISSIWCPGDWNWPPACTGNKAMRTCDFKVKKQVLTLWMTHAECARTLIVDVVWRFLKKRRLDHSNCWLHSDIAHRSTPTRKEGWSKNLKSCATAMKWVHTFSYDKFDYFSQDSTLPQLLNSLCFHFPLVPCLFERRSDVAHAVTRTIADRSEKNNFSTQRAKFPKKARRGSGVQKEPVCRVTFFCPLRRPPRKREDNPKREDRPFFLWLDPMRNHSVLPP